MKQLRALEAVLREYYAGAAQPQEPDSVSQREFGFSFFDGGFRRHISFRSGSEFWGFVVKNAPRDVYFSVAKYRNPVADMHGKGWVAADLPFDLDAEQVLRTEDPLVKSGWLTQEAYDLIKREFLKLLEDFLERDFGLASKDYTLGFSGGRGYHVRVTDQVYASLDARMRRQIVEYVSLGKKPHPSQYSKVKAKVYPFNHAYGWNAKLFEWLKNAEASSTGVSPRDMVQRIIESARRAGSPQEFSVTQFQVKALESLLDAGVRERTVAIDERVTVDVNRLLRAPGTVHGGSGLLCRNIGRGEIEKFNPFTHASMRLRTRRKIRVTRLPVEVTVDGETLTPGQAGSTVEVNTGLAYYVVVRRGGEFVDEAI